MESIRRTKLEAENQCLKKQVADLQQELKGCRERVDSLSRQIERDDLTGIYNRAGFKKRMEQILAMQGAGALCFIDLDNFKEINDRFGHGYGDQVLCQVAGIIEAQAGPLDAAGRFGGDEFLIYMADASDEGDVRRRVGGIAEQIRRQTEGDVLTASIGIAWFTGRESLQELIGCADKALYWGKKNGKNQICIYTA